MLRSKPYLLAKGYSIANDIVGRLSWRLRWQHLSTVETRWEIDESHDMLNRQLLAEYFKRYAPFDSCFEFGCASGHNLPPLSKLFPDSYFNGYDINQKSIDYGSNKLGELNLNRIFLTSHKGLLPYNHDLVFTKAVLVHIPNPGKIIRDLYSLANKKLVIIEPHTFGKSERELAEMGIVLCDRGQWIHNYEKYLDFPHGKVTITKMPVEIHPASPWMELGAIIEIDKEDNEEKNCMVGS